MSGVTVAKFAETLKVPVDRLLEQLKDAGVSVKGADDVISDDAKMELLNHLRASHGRAAEKDSVAPRKITLSRRDKSELKMAGGQGRSRTVNVEVRRKKSYIKRDVLDFLIQNVSRGILATINEDFEGNVVRYKK